MLSFEVIEDNGGGLALAIFKGDKCIWLHCDYEYHPYDLLDDINAIKEGKNPLRDNWDGGVEKPQKIYNEIMNWEAFNRRIVADNNGVYINEMGCNAREAFGIKEEI